MSDPTSPKTPRAELTKERLEMIRARVEAGFYESPAVLFRVVEQMVARGDVSPST